MSCEHLDGFKVSKTSEAYHCDECIKTGDNWVHLRTCQEFGTTLCCDSSPNTHMTKHYKSHDHAVVISAEPKENWAWCYEHKQIKPYK